MELIDLSKEKIEEARGRIHASLTEGTRQEQQMAYRGSNGVTSFFTTYLQVTLIS